MTQDSDKTVLTRVAAIADALDDQLGLPHENALRGDFSLTAQLRRIEAAVPQIASLSSIVAAGSGKTISFVVQDPENIKTHVGRGTQSFPAFLNDTGLTLTLSRVVATSDTDDYAFSLLKSASESDLGVAGDVLLTAVVCSTDGVSSFLGTVSSFAVDTVEDGKWIIFQHDSGAAETLSVMIEGALS